MAEERPKRPGVPIGRAWPSSGSAPSGGHVPASERGGRGPRGEPPESTPATRRLFIAVPLGDEALAAVAGLVAQLRADETEIRGSSPGSGGRGLRWVRPEGVHLTLRFLGSTPSRLVAHAAAAVEAAAEGFGPFTVRLAGAGAFPRVSAPRVLWLGIDQGADRAAEIAASLEVELVAAGWLPEARRFSAHLTLARCDDPALGRPVAEVLVRRAASLDVRWTADRVVLFESRPGPGGSRYVVVAEVPLAG
jgi:RNA 2',3'-cyclic 3'-phosphodiesterase